MLRGNNIAVIIDTFSQHGASFHIIFIIIIIVRGNEEGGRIKDTHLSRGLFSCVGVFGCRSCTTCVPIGSQNFPALELTAQRCVAFCITSRYAFRYICEACFQTDSIFNFMYKDNGRDAPVYLSCVPGVLMLMLILKLVWRGGAVL